MSIEVLTLSGTRGGEPFTLDVPVERPGALAGAATIDNASWDAYTAPQPGGVGPLPSRRAYDGPNAGGVGASGIPSTLAASRAGPDIAAGRISVHSINLGSYATGASGGYNSQLSAFYSSAGTEHELIAIVKHEPEDEIQAGTITQSQYHQTQIHAATQLKNLGRPNLKFALCWRGFRTVYSYQGFDFYWHAGMAGLVDYLVIDPYYERFAGIPQTYQGYIQSSLDFARSKGLRVIIGEWGISQAHSDQTRANFVNEAWGVAKANADIDISMYWYHFTGNGDYRADPATWPLTHAALRNMATEGQPL